MPDALREGPLIKWMLRWLKKGGVEESVINLHYLPDKVKDYVGDGERYGLRVEYSFEPELLGPGGAVRKVADFLMSLFSSFMQTISVSGIFES